MAQALALRPLQGMLCPHPRSLPDGSLSVYDTDQAVRAEIDPAGAAYTLQDEEIKEDGAHPIRIGINLEEATAEATLTVRITPSNGPEEEEATGLLRNGGFEAGGWCWELPRNGLGSISDERAASGKSSLKITDTGQDVGSNVSSARIPVQGTGKYVLGGKAWHVTGSGIGLYMKLRDARTGGPRLPRELEGIQLRGPHDEVDAHRPAREGR